MSTERENNLLLAIKNSYSGQFKHLNDQNWYVIKVDMWWRGFCMMRLTVAEAIYSLFLGDVKII